MPASQPTSIRLLPALKTKLQRWAKTEERSLAGHISWLLERAVEWREKGERK